MSNPGFNMDTDDLTFSITGEVTHLAGALRLDGFPCLVCAPRLLGPGVRLEDTHVLVEQVYHAYVYGVSVDELARQFKTDARHIRDALAYSRAVRDC